MNIRLLYIALLLPFLNAEPIQLFLTEFWTLYGAKDAYIYPLDPNDLTNHCPRGGLYRAVAITIPEQRNTFQPIPSRYHRRVDAMA